MFAPAGQTTARAGQLCWLAALVVRRQAVLTAPPGRQTLAGWPVGAAYMPPRPAPAKRRIFACAPGRKLHLFIIYYLLSIIYLLFAAFVV